MFVSVYLDNQIGYSPRLKELVSCTDLYTMILKLYILPYWTFKII